MSVDLPKVKEEIEKEMEESKKPLTVKALFKEIFTFLTHTDLVNMVKFIVELLFIIIIVSLFKFPFELFIELIPKLFQVFTSASIMITVNKVVDLVFNILYALFGIYLMYRICSIRFINLSKRK